MHADFSLNLRIVLILSTALANEQLIILHLNENKAHLRQFFSVALEWELAIKKSTCFLCVLVTHAGKRLKEIVFR